MSQGLQVNNMTRVHFPIVCIIRMLQIRNKCISRAQICRATSEPPQSLAFHRSVASDPATDKGSRRIAGYTFQQSWVSADLKQVQLLFHLRSRIPQSRQVFHRDFHTARARWPGNLDFRHNASYATFLVRLRFQRFLQIRDSASRIRPSGPQK